MNKWDLRFLNLARHISSWSKDRSTNCGTIVVDKKNRVVGMGYNGLPTGIFDSEERLNNRELKYNLTVHSEMNAIAFANKSVENCTLYVWPMGPCVRCATMIIQVGIIKVIAPKLSIELEKRWGESMILTREIFKEVGIEFIEV